MAASNIPKKYPINREGNLNENFPRSQLFLQNIFFQPCKVKYYGFQGSVICLIFANLPFLAPISTITCIIETVQDFLIKLDIKPLIHLLEISIFSLNNDLIRLTKIMNNLVKDCKIHTFSHFSVPKIGQICPNFFFCEEYLIRRPTFINEIFLKL